MAKAEQREREEKWYMLRKRGRQEPDHIGLWPQFGTCTYQCVQLEDGS